MLLSKSFWCKISSAARRWISSVPPRSTDDLCLCYCINPSSMILHQFKKLNVYSVSPPLRNVADMFYYLFHYCTNIQHTIYSITTWIKTIVLVAFILFRPTLHAKQFYVSAHSNRPYPVPDSPFVLNSLSLLFVS